MQFNTELYWALLEIYPNLTVRSISKMMGRSQGYWSSVNAQNIAVSTSALVHLLDALTCLKIQSMSGSTRFERLILLTTKIEQELFTRFQEATGLEALVTTERPISPKNDNYSVMPFVVSSYR
jgi:hypothetical protein